MSPSSCCPSFNGERRVWKKSTHCLLRSWKTTRTQRYSPTVLESVRVQSNCGRFAQLLRPPRQPNADVNDPNPDTIRCDVIPCERCGSPAHVGRSYCLSCVLQQGLEYDGENTGHWDDVLEEVNVRGAEWRIGNYQILKEIGRGGNGVIYRARQRNSQGIVALKRILSVHTESRETLARFRHEAVVVASLCHPNILPIYELGETEDGLPFFTMKHAPGGTLLEAARSLRHDPRRSVRLIAKVSRAMQYAHGEGVLHRDLKPGNILLDENGEPLVSDFGLAKSFETPTNLTRTLTSFGTPGFIAPEQAHGPAKNLNPAADIYSIGAVLFYLLTGRPPFVGENALAVIKKLRINLRQNCGHLLPNSIVIWRSFVQNVWSTNQKLAICLPVI